MADLIEELISKPSPFPSAWNESCTVDEFYWCESDFVDACGVAGGICDVEFLADAGGANVAHASVWFDGCEWVVGDWDVG